MRGYPRSFAYRVCARDARDRVMHAEHPNNFMKHEAVEPHTIDNIMGFDSGVVIKPV